MIKADYLTEMEAVFIKYGSVF